MSKFEVEYETGDSWWWQATEPSLARAKQRLAELSARFPTRRWRIKEDGKVLHGEIDQRLANANEERAQQRFQADPPPDLQELVARHGGYDKITSEAWAEYDRNMTAWQLRRRVIRGRAAHGR